MSAAATPFPRPIAAAGSSSASPFVPGNGAGADAGAGMVTGPGGVLPVGRQPQTGSAVYATLVTSADFVIGAQVLAHSLRTHRAKYPLVVMVTPNISAVDRAALRAIGCGVVEVRPIPNPAQRVHVANWGDVGAGAGAGMAADGSDSSGGGGGGSGDATGVGFTKLRLWSLTQFSKIVYIDADCLVTANCDELFGRPDFAAAPDTFPPDRFNAGVMVVKPALAFFAALLQQLSSRVGADAYDGGDTGFLNAAIPDWYGRPSAARLSFGYNALRTMHWFTASKQPGYWSAVQPLKIVHYCSSPKPWETRAKGGALERMYWTAEDHTRAFLAAAATPAPTAGLTLAAPAATAATSVVVADAKSADAKSTAVTTATALSPFPALAVELLTSPLTLHELLASTATATADAAAARALLPAAVRSWSERTRGITFAGSMSKRATAVRAGYWASADRERRVADALDELYRTQIARAPVAATANAVAEPAAVAAVAVVPAPTAADPLGLGPSRGARAGYAIPPLLHQIWFGGEYPAAYRAWQRSWTAAHPTWPLRVWTDADASGFPYSAHNPQHLRALMASAQTPVERSDIFRLDVLCAFGGLYVDTDFECVVAPPAASAAAADAPAVDEGFDALHRRYACYMGVANTTVLEVNNGLVACAPNHPFICAVIDSMRLPKHALAAAATDSASTATATVAAAAPALPSAYDILDRTGPGHFTRCVFTAALPTPPADAKAAASASAPIASGTSLLASSNSLVLPLTYFYPFSNTLRGLPACDRVPLFVRRESMAVHHWAGSWKPALATARASAAATAVGGAEGKPTAAGPAASTNELVALLHKLAAAPPAAPAAATGTAAVASSDAKDPTPPAAAAAAPAATTAKTKTAPPPSANPSAALAALAMAGGGRGRGAAPGGNALLSRISGFL